MGGRLGGKVALVMGAGSSGPGWGNGKAVAALFAAEGARVFAVDRDLAAVALTRENIRHAGVSAQMRLPTSRNPPRSPT